MMALGFAYGCVFTILFLVVVANSKDLK